MKYNNETFHYSTCHEGAYKMLIILTELSHFATDTWNFFNSFHMYKFYLHFFFEKKKNLRVKKSMNQAKEILKKWSESCKCERILKKRRMKASSSKTRKIILNILYRRRENMLQIYLFSISSCKSGKQRKYLSLMGLRR